jgi:hypothetical protein
MKVIENKPVEKLVCDGCDYIIGLTTEERNDSIRVEERTMTLRMPWDTDPIKKEDWVWLEFHFHSPVHMQSRRDCFRYWAHNPRIMKRSLEYRELPEDEIDEFMSVMLYRDNKHGPGIERASVGANT